MSLGRSVWQCLAAVIRGSLLEGEADSPVLLSEQEEIVVDEFLSSPQEGPGQQIPQLQGTSHQARQLDPPSALCSLDYCVDRNFLKMAIPRKVLCMKCKRKI